MNYKSILKIIGKIMILEGALMVLPLFVSFIYHEELRYILSFLLPSLILILSGFLLQLIKPKRNSLYQKEAFALTAVVWLVMTIFGAIPFIINKDIPNYIDALFETMSGFTTTGASILDDVTILAHSSLFWRSFTHWIGGMGILVFILIFIPESDDGSSLHLLKAESPGPQVGKITSKMKVTARILYLIYLGLTVLETIFLMFSPTVTLPDGIMLAGKSELKMDLFYSLITAFGSAGTGGFGFLPASMEYVSVYSQYVISVFLILFGINFSLYFLLLIGKVKEVLKSEELRTYLLIILSSIAVMMISVIKKEVTLLGSLDKVNIEEIFRQSLFQTASIITTTGFSSVNYDYWPEIAKAVIVILMLCGAMAGSTGGGIKVSRFIIAVKGVGLRLRKLINPRYVAKTKFEGKSLEDNTINDVFSFITLYFIITFVVVIILSLDKVSGTVIVVDGKETICSFTSNFTAAISCMSNIGPGLESVGPYSGFSFYSQISKVVLTLTMMIGRLEILPVLILFNPRTYRK